RIRETQPAAQILKRLTEVVECGNHVSSTGSERLHALPLRNDAVPSIAYLDGVTGESRSPIEASNIEVFSHLRRRRWIPTARRDFHSRDVPKPLGERRAVTHRAMLFVA